MTKFCMPYSSEGCTAGVAFYEVANVEALYTLVIKDFFDYNTSDEDGKDILMSTYILNMLESDKDLGFYDICADYGVYFGEEIELDEALKYVCTEETYK